MFYPCQALHHGGRTDGGGDCQHELELESRLSELRANEKLLEAQRLEQRTRYDLEMLREVGYCSGIENYSRHIDGRPAGSAPGR